MKFKVSPAKEGKELVDIGVYEMIDSFERSAEQSEEGFLKDVADQNWLGPVALITALFQRNHHLLSHLYKAMTEVKHSLPDLDAEAFINEGEYSIAGKIKIKKRINLASKYLPDYDKFKDAVEGLEKLTKYLTTVDSAKYSLETAVSFLKNTIFTKEALNVSQKNPWKYAALALNNMVPYGFVAAGKLVNSTAQKAMVTLGASVSGKLSTVIWFYGMANEAVDIRDRGWDSVEKIKEGYQLTERLIKVIETASTYLKRYNTFTDKIQRSSTPIIHWLKYVSYEAGFLARGYTVAAYKACSPHWKRIALGLVD